MLVAMGLRRGVRGGGGGEGGGLADAIGSPPLRRPVGWTAFI